MIPAPFYLLAADHIPNLHRPAFYVYTAGQPDDEGFRQIAAMGIKTVINVLPQKQCMANEGSIARANNMAYELLPFELSGFRRETIVRFAEILKTSKKPVLIHCSTGNHVGGLWFAYRVLEEDVPLNQALIEARRIGINMELENGLFLWVVDEKPRLLRDTE
jgi:uncharacterized protein (TIGR01244 family)